MTSPCASVDRATAAHVGEVAPLFVAYCGFYERECDVDRASRFLAERLERDESVIFAARSRGTVVGFAQLYPAFSSLALRRVWLLNDLFVLSPERGLGIGRALLMRVMDFARETNAASVFLQTGVANSIARGLYESAGYVRDERFVRYDLALG